MTTYKTVNLEENIDLNELFHLNYNFDFLKGVITALIEGHRTTNGRIKHLELDNIGKDSKIKE
jgi:hypothetical protein